MTTRILVTALLTERHAERLCKALQKDTTLWAEKVEVERLVYPEQAMAAGKRAGARISLQLLEAARLRSRSTLS